MNVENGSDGTKNMEDHYVPTPRENKEETAEVGHANISPTLLMEDE